MVLHHIWDSGYQHGYSSYSSKSLAGDTIQFSVVPIKYVQFVAAFALLLTLLEVYLVACCLCSIKYGLCVNGYRAHFGFLCDLVALYCLCVVSSNPYNYHLLSVSWDENWLNRFYGQHDCSDNCRLEINLQTFLCQL